MFLNKAMFAYLHSSFINIFDAYEAFDKLVVPVHDNSLVEEGTCIVNVAPCVSSKHSSGQQIVVNTRLENTGWV